LFIEITTLNWTSLSRQWLYLSGMSPNCVINWRLFINQIWWLHVFSSLRQRKWRSNCRLLIILDYPFEYAIIFRYRRRNWNLLLGLLLLLSLISSCNTSNCRCIWYIYPCCLIIIACPRKCFLMIRINFILGRVFLKGLFVKCFIERFIIFARQFILFIISLHW
jgi:hypothetical protein